MNEFGTSHLSRQTAFYALAVLGFIAMVSLGVWLAVYSAQFVPVAINRLGAAAVSLSEIFNRAPSAPGTTATTTPGGTVATSTNSVTPPVATTTPGTGGQTVTPQPGEETSSIIPADGSSTVPYGLGDLTVTIQAVGHLTTASTDSFVTGTVVPGGYRPAVKFTVKNIGTNVIGPWRFSASLPTSATPLYLSNLQQQLNPGDYIEYTLGFEQPNRGEQTITLSVNYDRTIAESHTNNNTISAKLQIQ